MPLTSKQLIEAGIKPGELFGRCLNLDSIEEAIRLATDSSKAQQKASAVQMKPGTVWWWLCKNACLSGMHSIETGGSHASNSEKRRWLLQGAVNLNGRTDWGPDEEMPEKVTRLVFFQNSGKRKCTMVVESEVDSSKWSLYNSMALAAQQRGG